MVDYRNTTGEQLRFCKDGRISIYDRSDYGYGAFGFSSPNERSSERRIRDLHLMTEIVRYHTQNQEGSRENDSWFSEDSRFRRQRRFHEVDFNGNVYGLRLNRARSGLILNRRFSDSSLDGKIYFPGLADQLELSSDCVKVPIEFGYGPDKYTQFYDPNQVGWMFRTPDGIKVLSDTDALISKSVHNESQLIGYLFQNSARPREIQIFPDSIVRGNSRRSLAEDKALVEASLDQPEFTNYAVGDALRKALENK